MADPEPDTRNSGRMDGRTDRQTDGKVSLSVFNKKTKELRCLFTRRHQDSDVSRIHDKNHKVHNQDSR